MLPAYLSYFVGTGDEAAETRPEPVRRALNVGGVVSAAFLVVFGTAGALITAGLQRFTDAIPWLALLVGIGVFVLGIAMLCGFEPTLAPTSSGRAGHGRSRRAVFTFGVSYAVASLSCTLPVFLSVVALQAQRAGLVSGVLTFLAYGAVMAMLLVGVTIAVGLGQQGIVSVLRRSTRYVNCVAAVILIVTSVYIVWFWSTNLAAGATALGASGPFRFVEGLSQRAFAIVGDHPAIWGLGLGALIATSLVWVLPLTGGTTSSSERESASLGSTPPDP
jgi:cytochrome c-type biogenesis protein